MIFLSNFELDIYRNSLKCGVYSRAVFIYMYRIGEKVVCELDIYRKSIQMRRLFEGSAYNL